MVMEFLATIYVAFLASISCCINSLLRVTDPFKLSLYFYKSSFTSLSCGEKKNREKRNKMTILLVVFCFHLLNWKSWREGKGY